MFLDYFRTNFATYPVPTLLMIFFMWLIKLNDWWNSYALTVVAGKLSIKIVRFIISILSIGKSSKDISNFNKISFRPLAPFLLTTRNLTPDFNMGRPSNECRYCRFRFSVVYEYDHRCIRTHFVSSFLYLLREFHVPVK